MVAKTDAVYQPIPLDEEQPSSEKSRMLSQPAGLADHPQTWGHFRKNPSFLVWTCNGLLFSMSLICLALSFWMRVSLPLDHFCAQYLSPYSPAQSVVRYETVRYNITPVLEHSEYVGYGPEVDKAWDHITYDVGDQMINREELDRLGLDPKSLTIKHPKTGAEGYRVGIQVFHQLHCLNLLRQDSYKDYYSHHGGDIETTAENLRGHLDHCLEILRINLMCQSDVGVYPFKYYDGFDGHWPDFSTLHTCRNFYDIRDWAFENAVVFGDED